MRDHLRKVFIPRRRFLILYPEGGFPHHLKEVNKKYAKKHNLPELKHSLLPRIGAMKNIIDVLVPADGKRYLDYVVDITIAYEIENSFSKANIGWRRENSAYFLYRVYKIDEVSSIRIIIVME